MTLTRLCAGVKERGVIIIKLSCLSYNGVKEGSKLSCSSFRCAEFLSSSVAVNNLHYCMYTVQVYMCMYVYNCSCGMCILCIKLCMYKCHNYVQVVFIVHVHVHVCVLEVPKQQSVHTVLVTSFCITIYGSCMS